MNAREVIAEALRDAQEVAEMNATRVAQALAAAGFAIMSKEDVEAVREEILERASEAALAILINDTDSNPRLAAKVESAIRSLKSGGRDAD